MRAVGEVVVELGKVVNGVRTVREKAMRLRKRITSLNDRETPSRSMPQAEVILEYRTGLASRTSFANRA